jgi:hypothetical protein
MELNLLFVVLSMKPYLSPINHAWMINFLIGKQKINDRTRFHYHCGGHICTTY